MDDVRPERDRLELRQPGITFTRDGLGTDPTQIEGPDDETVTYGYDAAGDLVSPSRTRTRTSRHFTYRPGHYLESILDPLDRPTTTLIEYHPDGRLDGR